MKARIAKKIYYHHWLADKCLGEQRSLKYIGSVFPCQYDNDCQKCCFYDKEAKRLNHTKQQLDKAERIFNRQY